LRTKGDVEGDLRKDVSMHIKRLIDIQSYRGTASPAVAAGARPAHPHQRPHSQGPAQGHVAGKKKATGKT
jgi:small subunit ribosomal protein S13